MNLQEVRESAFVDEIEKISKEVEKNPDQSRTAKILKVVGLTAAAAGVGGVAGSGAGLFTGLGSSGIYNRLKGVTGMSRNMRNPLRMKPGYDLFQGKKFVKDPFAIRKYISQVDRTGGKIGLGVGLGTAALGAAGAGMLVHKLTHPKKNSD